MKNLAKFTVGTIFILILLLNFNVTAFACAEPPKIEVTTPWEVFRKSFPFHIQVLAYDRQNAVLVISEPPTHVTLEQLKVIAPELKQVEVKQHIIGCDGWVKDLVIKVPQMNNPERQDLFDRVNLYLFHTTYKANVLELPFNKSIINNENAPLDVAVTFSDLKDWLIDKNEIFSSVHTGDQIQFNNIISQKKNGVYVSNAPGLVIWAIDRKKPLNDYLAEARQFSLDSDLIVGAISNADMLAIVGRKRILPLDIFPPLRTETILQLAAVKNPDLGQSYERNYVFAGRFNETNDWAPIYLSDELIDTEYGSLLNITDQILKRWSMKGTVDYKNFESYEDPKKFPFIDKTLVEYLNNAPEVTFNWNTFGLGYSSEVGGNRIFAINRTGALPTTYLSGDQDNFSEAEEIGYDYFAKIGDPNLTRVVQYAALYQIFQQSKVTTGKEAFSFEKHTPNYEELYQELTGIISEIKAISMEKVNFLEIYPDTKELADAIKKIKTFSNKKEFEATARSILDPRNLNNQYNKRIDEYFKEKRRLLKKLKDLESSIGSNTYEFYRTDQEGKRKVVDYNNSCAYILMPPNSPERNKCVREKEEINRLKIRFTNLQQTLVRLKNETSSTFQQFLNLDSDYGVFVDFSKALRKASKDFVRPSDANRLKDVYLRSLPERASKWIHTPSIVVSSNSDVNSVGGHNLNSKTTVFKSGLVPRGKVTINKQGSELIILMNGKDINGMSSLVRTAAVKNKTVEVTELKKELEQIIASQPPIPPVAKSTALKFSNVNLPRTQLEKQGYIPVIKSDSFNDDIIRITKRDDNTEIVAYRNMSAVTNSPTSRNDCLRSLRLDGKNPVRIKMDGYNEVEGNALIQSMKLPSKPVVTETGFIQRIRNLTGNYLARDYNFAQAKISTPKTEVIKRSGADVTKVSVDIEVPHISTKESGLSYQATTFFKGIISKVKERQVIQKFQALLNKKFRVEKYPVETEAQSIVSDVENEMRAVFPDAFDSKVFLYDVTISENWDFIFEEDANAE